MDCVYVQNYLSRTFTLNLYIEVIAYICNTASFSCLSLHSFQGFLDLLNNVIPIIYSVTLCGFWQMGSAIISPL